MIARKCVHIILVRNKETAQIRMMLSLIGIPDSSVGKESACNAGDPGFDSWVGKIPWGRDRLRTPVFWGFPCGSAGKESTCNVGDLGSIPGLERSPGEGNKLPTPVFWPGEFHGL